MYSVTEVCLCNHCCSGISITIISMCVCSLSYPACTKLLRVACLALQYFSTLSDKQQDFQGGKEIEHKMRFDFLSNFSL